MRVLVTGAGGQVARAFTAAAPAGCEISAFGRGQLDIRDAEQVDQVMARLRPDLVLNAAAYTAVDRAEAEPAAAHAINAAGAGHVARAAERAGARLIHLSTDFVFDGRSSRPYAPADPAAPLSVYGASKLAGEVEVAAAPSALIVRTAWVYARDGANFLATMLRLMASAPQVRVVADQIGAPTAAPVLARALWDLALAGASGVVHFTNAGVASWYDFAQAIAEEAVAAGFLVSAAPVVPITTADYPTAAVRPAFSVLDTTATSAMLGGPPPHWRVSLREVLATMGAER